MSIQYRIVPQSPGAHYFDLTLTIQRPAVDGQILSLPSWIPGSYLVRDFARNIIELTASNADGAVLVAKLDKDRWQLAPSTSPVVVSYRIYANDLSVRTAFLDDRRGFFNGTSVFLAVVGQENSRCTVDIESASFTSDWKVATSLPRDGAPAWGFGRYAAASYHELIDHPVELAKFTVVSFEACGVPHHMVLSAAGEIDEQRMAADLVKICETHIRRFGNSPPFAEYWFLTAIVPGGYGGLEHLDSTALICPPEDMPRVGQVASDGYTRFLELCSHEYFHCWNVKRIQPAAFQPFDLSRENFTTLLWAFEGITSYYDQLGVLQAGCIDYPRWLVLIGENLTRVQRGRGRFRQTLRESSFDAWTKFYKQDENADNAIVSYYVKGGLLVMGLEMSLRLASDGRVSMDDVMRLAWQRHGLTGQGVPETGFETIVADVLAADGSDARASLALLAQGLDGKDDLPLSDLFAQFGVVVNWRCQQSSGDKGGRLGDSSVVDSSVSQHGVSLSVAAPNGVVLARLSDQGPAAAAGLSAGDVLIAIDGHKADVNGLDRLRRCAPGTVVEMHVFRREHLRSYSVVLAAAEKNTAWLSNDTEASEEAIKRRVAWLGE